MVAKTVFPATLKSSSAPAQFDISEYDHGLESERILNTAATLRTINVLTVRVSVQLSVKNHARIPAPPSFEPHPLLCAPRRS